MLKSKLYTATLALSLLTTSLAARGGDYAFESNSLVGIEAGGSSLSYEYGTPDNNTQSDITLANLGLKLGAETRDFRLFLSGRYYYDSSRKHDYIVTYGAEFQYKFNVSSFMNAYIGASGGVASLAFRADGETFTRTISDPYFGGDAGVNFHVTKSVDWELGARVISIQADNLRDSKTYHINEIVSAYTSIIFRWKMD